MHEKSLIYISNIQSASENNGCGLFVYRIYEEFHINLCECSTYGYCYIFLIQVSGLSFRLITLYIYQCKCTLGDCITENNNIYVGLTSTTLSRRLTMHLSDTSSLVQH